MIAMKSQVPMKQKLILITFFSLSLIITIFSIVRFALNSPSRGTAGPSWIQTWSTIEQSVSVSVACLASFRTLVISNSRTPQRSPRPAREVRHFSNASSSHARTGKPSFPHLRSQRSGSMDIELIEHRSSKSPSQEVEATKEIV